MSNSNEKDKIAENLNSLKEFKLALETNTIKGIKEMRVELDILASGINKSFGIGRDLSKEIETTLTSAVKGVEALGGDLNSTANIQLEVSKTLGRNVILQSDSFKDLYAAQQVTGKGADQLVSAFKNIGVSTYQVAENTQTIFNISRALGVNAQAVTGVVLQNIDAINKYNFQGGVEGLARMAAQATSLRIDMNTTLGFAEKVFDPEGAIKMASAFQRLGVAQSDLLDPLRLMDLSQNDPAELQKQISQMTQQFVQLGKSGRFEIAPDGMRTLRELQKETGIAYNELTKMALGGAEMNRKLQEIKFPDVFTEDQKQMIMNMTEMGPGGVYTLKVDGKEMGVNEAMKLFQEDKGKMDKFMEASKPKDIADLAYQQLEVDKQILAGINTMVRGRISYPVASSDMMREFHTAIPKTIEIMSKSFGDMSIMNMNKIQQKLDEEFTELKGKREKGEGLPDLKEILNDLPEIGKKIKNNFETELGDASKKISTEMKDSGNLFVKILGDGIDKMIEKFQKAGLFKPKDFIYSEKLGKIDLYEEDTIIGGSSDTMKNIASVKPEIPQISLPTIPTTPITTTSTKETSGNIEHKGEIKIVVDVQAPSGVDVASLNRMFSDPIFLMEMSEKLKKVSSNSVYF